MHNSNWLLRTELLSPLHVATNSSASQSETHTRSSKVRFIELLDKITRSRNSSKNRYQTRTGKTAESSPQTSSSAVNPASTLDEHHEATLPNASVSTLIGNGNSPVISPESNIASKSASIHKALWEKAYSSLKSDKKKAEYVITYEELLSTVLLNQNMADQGFGEDQMKEVIALGLKKIEKYKEAIDYSEGKLEAVKAIKSIIGIPLSNIPQIALPWAIISSTIDVSEFQRFKKVFIIYNLTRYATRSS